MDIASLLNQLIMEQYNATPSVLNTPKAPGRVSDVMWETSAFPAKANAGIPVAEYGRYENMQLPPTEYLKQLTFPAAQYYADNGDPSQNSYRSDTGLGPTQAAASRGRMLDRNPRR